MTHNREGAYIYQVNVSQGGVPKLPVDAAHVTEQGVTGDKQRNRRFHGGPQRAISLYSLDVINALHAEGHPIAPGTTGENLTIAGIDWEGLRVGDQLRIGADLQVEITSYAAPCANIAESFVDGGFKRISQKLHPGTSRLYARVITPGQVRSGDPVTVLISSPAL